MLTVGKMTCPMLKVVNIGQKVAQCRLSLAWGKSFLPNVENIIILAQCWQFFSFSMFFLFWIPYLSQVLKTVAPPHPVCVYVCDICVCVWLHHTLCVCIGVCMCVYMCVCPALSKSSLEECGSTTLRVCVCMCVCACVTLYLSQVWKTIRYHEICFEYLMTK